MDDIKPQSGFIKSKEVLLKANHEWLYFSNPRHVLTAEYLDDVRPAIQELERLIFMHRWHAAGFLSYEAAPAFDPALQTKPSNKFPYLWFGLYPEPQIVTLPPPKTPKAVLDWRPTTDYETYQAAITNIKECIADGKTYQVNYTMRLQTDFMGNAWDYFLRLVQQQNNYAAYVDTGRYRICSASPELFFEIHGNTITCRPMKGTVKRGRTTLEDHHQSNSLRTSEKNRAENVMIVDMIRNDLAKIARTGSVHVTNLFETERYPTLWQMTSTIRAETKASLADIFMALFPSGSITGAPKVSTMKIIAELEDMSRKIYTGTIGYMSPERKASFNVAIRTVLIDAEDQKAEYGIGGGVVWDSSSTDEYAETFLKAQVVMQQAQPFSLFETMLWTPEYGFFLREQHIARMVDSAAYFDIPLTKGRLEKYLEQLSALLCSPGRVRVLLDASGHLTNELQHFELAKESQTLRICLAKQPVDSTDVFLFHKTTQRQVYESARKTFPRCDDVLLYNERGELTEFTIGNLVVELDRQMLTPPISCGVLAGTFRAHLLATGQVLEKPISRARLPECTKVFRVNSIRQWQQAELQDQGESLSLE